MGLVVVNNYQNWHFNKNNFWKQMFVLSPRRFGLTLSYFGVSLGCFRLSPRRFGLVCVDFGLSPRRFALSCGWFGSSSWRFGLVWVEFGLVWVES